MASACSPQSPPISDGATKLCDISGSAIKPGLDFNSRKDVIQNAGADTFQLVSVLGKGAFGIVYHVTEKRTGRSYAMKVLSKERYFEEDGLRYAITEKDVQSSINHPFIVGFKCAFQTTHELVIVMQFCPGGSLLRLVESQTRLPEEISTSYFCELFLAIEYLHSLDVAYRDLKCENAVIDGLGHAMLTDFGLSKERVVDPKGTGSFVGSISFGAPEVLSSKRYGKAVDVYGLGVVFFEMLNGAPPFFSECAKTVVQNIKTAELEIPDFISTECSGFLHALLERDPMRRLGALNTPDVRLHPFLAAVDFDSVMRREAPVLPPLPLPPPDDSPPVSPFQRRRTLLSILGGTTVNGWEFPRSSSGLDSLPESPRKSDRTPRGTRCIPSFGRLRKSSMESMESLCEK